MRHKLSCSTWLTLILSSEITWLVILDISDSYVRHETSWQVWSCYCWQEWVQDICSAGGCRSTNIHIFMFTYVFVYISMYMYIHTCLCVCVFKTYVRQVYIFPRIRIYPCVHMCIYIYLYIRTYILLYVCVGSWRLLDSCAYIHVYM